MYSMVLMVAMTSNPALPDFGRRGRGGCCGCYGGYARGGCYGGYGYGGCYGGYGYGGCYGGYGYGGGYGGWGYGYGGGYGRGYGRRILYGTPAYSMPYYAATPVYGTPVLAGGTPVITTAGYSPAAATNGEMPARLVVHLPADANLTVDGEATRATSDTRTFVTPPLEPGKTYHYRLKATITRNGEKETASQTVIVHAGQTSPVYMEFPTRNRLEK